MLSCSQICFHALRYAFTLSGMLSGVLSCPQLVHLKAAAVRLPDASKAADRKAAAVRLPDASKAADPCSTPHSVSSPRPIFLSSSAFPLLAPLCSPRPVFLSSPRFPLLSPFSSPRPVFLSSLPLLSLAGPCK
ncbi:unnamed protein product [Closterium sp. Naga37s-1]|nr:unnamed protein product [Closterium sp. Naga37s-1]